MATPPKTRHQRRQRKQRRRRRRIHQRTAIDRACAHAAMHRTHDPAVIGLARRQQITLIKAAALLGVGLDRMPSRDASPSSPEPSRDPQAEALEDRVREARADLEARSWPVHLYSLIRERSALVDRAVELSRELAREDWYTAHGAALGGSDG